MNENKKKPRLETIDENEIVDMISQRHLKEPETKRTFISKSGAKYIDNISGLERHFNVNGEIKITYIPSKNWAYVSFEKYKEFKTQTKRKASDLVRAGRKEEYKGEKGILIYFSKENALQHSSTIQNIIPSFKEDSTIELDESED